MSFGICFECFSHYPEIISPIGIGNNEHSVMGPVFIEKLDRKPDKIVSISRYHASLMRSGILQLFKVACLDHADFVSTCGIDFVFSEYLGDYGTHVFIQIIFDHGLPTVRKGYFCLILSGVHCSFSAMSASISSR